MASRDFNILTLRSIQAYQSNGARAVPGSILTVGGIGDGIFSTSISPCTINVSTITINTETVCTIYIDNIAGVSTVNASTINTLSLNSRCIETSSINTSTITVSSLIALPSATGTNTLFVDGTNKLFYNGLVVNTGVLSTVSTVYWEPAGSGLTGVITNSNDGSPVENPRRYMVGIGTNFDTDVRSTLNGTLDIQYRGGDNTGNALYVSSNGNTFAVANMNTSGINEIIIDINDNQNSNTAPTFNFNKSRGFETTLDNDVMGTIEFNGRDTGDSLQTAAYIVSRQQGNAGSDYVPGTLEFWTTGDSDSAGGKRRVIIDPFGQVGVNCAQPYKIFQVSTSTQTALEGIACNSISNSREVNTVVGAYSQGNFANSNVGSIQVTTGYNSSNPYTLAINPRGGDVYIGSSIASTFINGGTNISTLQVYTINGQVFDPTQDTHWTAYEIPPGAPVNVYNANDGAVGIGTGENISANTKFQVNGNTLLQGNFSQFGSTFYFQPNTPSYIDSFKIELDNANCMIYKSTINGGPATFLQNNGGNQLALGTTQPVITINGTNNGNNFVGISNVNPQYNLDVGGSCYISSGIVVNEVAYGGLKLEGGANENAMFIRDGTATAPNPYDGYFVGNSFNFGGPSTFQIGRIDNGTVDTSKAIFMTQAGNVGIGTTTPVYKLDVIGSTQITWAGTRRARIGTSIPREGFALTWNEIQARGNGQTELISGRGTAGSGGGGFDFFVNVADNTAAVAGDLAVCITADKKMGIATNNPQYTLDVAGTANISGNLTVGGSAISKVACASITSTSPTWSNYLGKYNFVNGDTVGTLSLPLPADVPSVTDGTIIVLRNIGLTTSITVGNTFDTAGTNILPGRTSSYVYTTTAPTAGWYGL